MRLVDVWLDTGIGSGLSLGGGRCPWLSVRNEELYLGQQKLPARFTLVLIQRTECAAGGQELSQKRKQQERGSLFCWPMSLSDSYGQSTVPGTRIKVRSCCWAGPLLWPRNQFPSPGSWEFVIEWRGAGAGEHPGQFLPTGWREFAVPFIFKWKQEKVS